MKLGQSVKTLRVRAFCLEKFPTVKPHPPPWQQRRAGGRPRQFSKLYKLFATDVSREKRKNLDQTQNTASLKVLLLPFLFHFFLFYSSFTFPTTHYLDGCGWGTKCDEIVFLQQSTRSLIAWVTLPTFQRPISTEKSKFDFSIKKKKSNACLELRKLLRWLFFPSIFLFPFASVKKWCKLRLRKMERAITRIFIFSSINVVYEKYVVAKS